MKIYKKLLAVTVMLIMVFASFAGCTTTPQETGTEAKQQKDIYVYFTGDAHCADNEGLGYAGVKAIVDYTRSNITEYVTLVDTGDAVWGDFLGNNSEGEYIIELMNMVGYDYAVLGNHEFDYGIPQLRDLMAASKAKYLSCNIRYTGTKTNLLDLLMPYAIETYGETKVGYIGVTTPESITNSTPTYFMEDGNFVYDFYQGNKDEFYAHVQTQIDACRNAGAKHVILLTHLGDGESYGEYSSDALIKATNGVDAVLDGHAHSTIPSRMIKNKDGKIIPLASTGTGLQNIGRLVISPAGSITVTLINGDIGRADDVDDHIDDANASYDEILSQVIAKSDFTLETTNADGSVRIVRTQEMPIGNLCADSYRASTGADIAFINGGGIRASLPTGDITYGDILALHPYGNNICVVNATGQEIADALEFSARLAYLDDNGAPAGENGGFLQVSGLKYTIDTSISSTVVEDSNGMFASVAGERRVCDILVENKDGTYSPIDLTKTYTLASFNYTLQDCGDGYSMFADNDYAVSLGKFDYETLIDYITSFEGSKIPERYATTEGRITIK